MNLPIFKFYQPQEIRILLIILLSAIGYFLYNYGDSEYENREWAQYDSMLQERGSQHVPKEIALIGIDKASYDQLKLPTKETFPRVEMTRLLHKLASAKVKGIAIDLLFSFEDDPSIDAQLAHAMTLTPVVLPGDVFLRKRKQANDEEIITRAVMFPSQKFKEAVKAIGRYSFTNSIIRYFPPLKRLSNDTPEHVLSFEAARIYDPTLELPSFDNHLLINYYGPSEQTVATYSVAKVLEMAQGELSETFHDKLVFIGSTHSLGADGKGDGGQGAGPDTFSIPGQELKMYGVEIHATLASNFIHRDYFQRLGNGKEIVALCTLIVGLFLLFVLVTMPPIPNGKLTGNLVYPPIVATIVFFISYHGLPILSSFLLIQERIFLPVMTVAETILPKAFILTFFYIFLSHMKIKLKYGSFLTPDDRRIAENEVRFNALSKGEKETRTMSVLFIDIAGSTSEMAKLISGEKKEKSLDIVRAVLDGYIEKTQGSWKILGNDDRLVVYWNAHQKVENPETVAFTVALKLRQELRAHNIRATMGIHASEVDISIAKVAGAATVDFYGKAFNICSRLEAIAKNLGASFVCTKDILEKSGSNTDYGALFLGEGTLRGDTSTSALYEVIDGNEHDQIDTHVWSSALKKYASDYTKQNRENVLAFAKGATVKLSRLISNLVSRYTVVHEICAANGENTLNEALGAFTQFLLVNKFDELFDKIVLPMDDSYSAELKESCTLLRVRLTDNNCLYMSEEVRIHHKSISLFLLATLSINQTSSPQAYIYLMQAKELPEEILELYQQAHKTVEDERYALALDLFKKCYEAGKEVHNKTPNPSMGIITRFAKVYISILSDCSTRSPSEIVLKEHEMQALLDQGTPL